MPIPSEIIAAADPDSPVSAAVRRAAAVTLWAHDPEFRGTWRKSQPPTAEEFAEYIAARAHFEQLIHG
jgi:hypothetical protein